MPMIDLVVFAENPARFEAIARRLAGRWKLRIVSLGRPATFADRRREIVSPIAWLRTLKGARVVLTDFFHGTAVSMRFGRPLVVSAPAIKTAKISDLLRRTGMSELYLDANEQIDTCTDRALADPAAYAARIAAAYAPHLQRSQQYLASALAPIAPAPAA